MPKDQLVTSFVEAKANIDRYVRDLSKNADLQAIMSYARSWHGYLASDGRWRVAPSKFVGYAHNNAAAYLRLQRERDGRRTERSLSAWFDEAKPGSAAHDDITAAVLALFARYGRTPNKRLRVNAPTTERQSRLTAGRRSKLIGRFFGPESHSTLAFAAAGRAFEACASASATSSTCYPPVQRDRRFSPISRT
jgi:hypothetical protein